MDLMQRVHMLVITKGYSTIEEAKADPYIKDMLEQVLEEIKNAVISEYSNPQEKLAIFLDNDQIQLKKNLS